MWKFEYSVECQASRDCAWRFWSDVDNWPAVDPSVESVKLDGLFMAGTKGMTKPRGLEPVEWRLAEVQEYSRARIEIPAPGTVLTCLWIFEDTLNGGTSITQQCSLEGEQAVDYAGQLGLNWSRVFRKL